MVSLYFSLDIFSRAKKYSTCCYEVSFLHIFAAPPNGGEEKAEDGDERGGGDPAAEESSDADENKKRKEQQRDKGEYLFCMYAW